MDWWFKARFENVVGYLSEVGIYKKFDISWNVAVISSFCVLSAAT